MGTLLKYGDSAVCMLGPIPGYTFESSKKLSDLIMEIYHDLQRRRWSHPKVRAYMHTYIHTGGVPKFFVGDALNLASVHMLSKIEIGRDICINVYSGYISGIIAKGCEMHFFPDGSGPSYKEYIGDDWETDKERFFVGYIDEKIITYRAYSTYEEGKFVCEKGNNKKLGIFTDLFESPDRSIDVDAVFERIIREIQLALK
jgi:hypothetical protein